MTFETVFKIFSYTAVFCGFLSLWVSGTFGVVESGLFVAVLVAGWFLENTRWQISEKLGTVLIVLALPLFYLGWKFRVFSFASSEMAVAGILSRLILSLTAIKLLQKKSDRDWIFLYLMAFFEVLLAAGLSISATYLGTFLLYLLVMVCAVIAFEMRKTTRRIAMLPANAKADAKADASTPSRAAGLLTNFPIRRLPLTAVVLIFFIVLLAMPLFFMLPRVGGAGIGADSSGVSTSSGFSDTVRLGGIGRIQQNDETVMRVRVEDPSPTAGALYWRGVALDTFDGRSWSKSRKAALEPFSKGDKEFIQVDYATGRDSLTRQVIYLEPLDTPVIFGLSRVVAVQGNFSTVFRDAYGALSVSKNGFERLSYRAVSDTSTPTPDELRADRGAYGPTLDEYLQLPDSLDPRVAELAIEVTGGRRNAYDKARALESYLQTSFGYTLEQKAGGADPLADFLFNVREGHCEYFATAMTVMLRTQGIPARIVNGFQQGEYNETAGVYVVKQRHAHSWVEVYFPGENAWVRFDPTPFAGQPAAAVNNGIAGGISKYIEALETFWIQYFVAFDNQEQRSLFRSVRNGFVDYQSKTSGYFADYRERLERWWSQVRGDQGTQSSVAAIGYGALVLAATTLAVLLLLWIFRKIKGLGLWQRFVQWISRSKPASVVEFYERLQRILASKGFNRQPHQTPLEFAYAVGMPEAVRITEKYNRVRFGEKDLSNEEAKDIENWLDSISVAETYKRGE